MVIRQLPSHRVPNPWENSDKSALVKISTHALHISTSGPAREPGQPVLLFFSGGGAPCALYLRLKRLLSTYIRVYFYDRSGYGDSEVGPGDNEKPHDVTGTVLTSQSAARELEELLSVINVRPPYILLGHSYGAICARSFLSICARSQTPIAGMVLAEPATELMYELLQPSIPPPSFEKVARGLDYEAITHERERSQLTDGELEYIDKQIEKTASAAAQEDPRFSARRLHCEKQFAVQLLGAAPLSVICADFAKTFQLLYEEGVKMGNGTVEERRECKQFLETADLFNDEMRASQLCLSTCNRFRRIRDEDHSLPITNPNVLVEEVRWLLRKRKTG